MDLYEHDLDYLAQARWHHFEFQLGRMDGLDRARRVVKLAPTLRRVERRGADPAPRDRLRHARDRGRQPHQRFRHARARASTRSASTRRTRPSSSTIVSSTPAYAPTRRPTPLRPEQLNVAIIGAGATGVELAAELHKTTRELVAYGFERIDPERDIRMTIVEAGPRILAGAARARRASPRRSCCARCSVEVLTGERVTEVRADAVVTASGRTIPRRAHGVGGRHQGARLPERPRRPRNATA